jgi:hypothetical protein
LTLRVEKSIDQYIGIDIQEYQRSCYGLSLEELVSMPKPVRDTEQFDAVEGAGETAAVAPATLSIPKELWRLVDALWSSSGAMQEAYLFAAPGIDEEVRNTFGFYLISLQQP